VLKNAQLCRLIANFSALAQSFLKNWGKKNKGTTLASHVLLNFSSVWGGFMSTAHSYIDQNQQKPVVATSIMSETEQHEVRCGMCAKELYVDDEGYSRYCEAINSVLDNPFRCEVCSEYDDLA
jgi:hypothetical protein